MEHDLLVSNDGILWFVDSGLDAIDSAIDLVQEMTKNAQEFPLPARAC